MRCMKLGFSTLGCPTWSLEKVTGAARDLGYEAVELRLLDGEGSAAGLSDIVHDIALQVSGSGGQRWARIR